MRLPKRCCARARACGPESPDRLVHLSRPDRRRQDRARAGASRVSLRRRTRADSHRHVGVSGEAHGRASARRAAGIRGIRRRRPAYRSRSPASVFRDPVRRIEKAHPDVFNVFLQILDDGRLTDGQGPHGRFQKHDRHHDVEHRQPSHPRFQGLVRRRGLRGDARDRARRTAPAFPSGVPQSRGRDHRLPRAERRAS